VRVREAGDLATAAVRELLALPRQAGFVVLEGGDLPASSSLRKLAEGAPTAAALPCFRDEAGDLAGLVRALLAEHGMQAQPEALSFLESHLGADRGVTKAEIAKLALYMADRAGAPVTLENAAAVVGDSSALGVDDAVNAAVLGRRRELDRALDRLLAEGEAPVRLIRAAAAMLTRLLRLSGAVAAGGTIDAVVTAARPPVFFRHRPVFVAALGRWSPEALARGLGLLQAAELRCKSAGAPEALICRAALAQLAGVPGPRQLPADGGANRR
jgi:DNA polymerase-3 subunit delta